MERIIKITFLLLITSPIFLASCSDCEDCNPITWNEEYHIVNSSKFNVEIVKNTLIDNPKEESFFIAPSDSLVVKREESGMGGYFQKPFQMINRIVFDNQWINPLTAENRYNIDSDYNYKIVFDSQELRSFRYVITDNDQIYVLMENSLNHRYCIINNSGYDVKVVNSKDSVFIASNDSLIIVKEKKQGEFRDPFCSFYSKFSFGSIEPIAYPSGCKFNFGDRCNFEILSFNDSLASFRYIITEKDVQYASNQ